MKKKTLRIQLAMTFLLVGLTVALFHGALSTTAFADGSTSAAKSEGVVGEQTDGYLGFPKGFAAPDIAALVKSTNLARRNAYAQIAESRSVAVRDVAAVAGVKLVKDAPSGESVRGSDGRWSQKP